ncbi:MAG TPA: tripartite tricarboxylate transporter TctB family protein [Burkholderiales bacterium]|nr:tripartite tricarboxylate transporter TctB family protein [Burkholderiales bacterium]
MKLSIRSQEDFWAGLLFIGFGVLAIVVSRDYPMGSAMRMGPGYFPTHVGALLVLIGAVVSGLSFKIPGGRVTRFAWRPIMLLSVAFAVFGWGMDHIGFVPSLAALVFLCALGGRRFRLLEVIILMIIMVAFGVGVFVYGLELPYPLFWWR